MNWPVWSDISDKQKAPLISITKEQILSSQKPHLTRDTKLPQHLLFWVHLTKLVTPSAFVQKLKGLHPAAAPAEWALLERHQHSPWAHHLLTGLSVHPVCQKAVEIQKHQPSDKQEFTIFSLLISKTGNLVLLILVIWSMQINRIARYLCVARWLQHVHTEGPGLTPAGD